MVCVRFRLKVMPITGYERSMLLSSPIVYFEGGQGGSCVFVYEGREVERGMDVFFMVLLRLRWMVLDSSIVCVLLFCWEVGSFGYTGAAVCLLWNSTATYFHRWEGRVLVWSMQAFLSTWMGIES